MAEADVDLAFGNQRVSIHLLDLTEIQTLDGLNLTYRTSSYSVGEWEGAGNNVILGDAFLRNIYAVYNYGGFVKTESGLTINSAFIQSLSLTDMTLASADFRKVRAQALASLPPEVDIKTINDPTPKLAVSSSSGHPTSGSSLGSLLSASNLDWVDSSGDPSAESKALSQLAPIIGTFVCLCRTPDHPYYCRGCGALPSEGAGYINAQLFD